MKYAAVIVIVLTVGFVVVPTAPVQKHVGVYEGNYFVPDLRAEKSGLRIAIEGRLAWLGVL